MHGQKLTLNEVNKEKINYHLIFNRVQINEKVFVYHNFPQLSRYFSEAEL